jgi:hypothetical protein
MLHNISDGNCDIKIMTQMAYLAREFEVRISAHDALKKN